MASSRQDKASVLSRLETLTAVIVIGLLAAMLGFLALVMPSETVERRSVDYTHRGAFTYSADAPEGSLYGPEGLSTGEPILVNVVGRLHVEFHYELRTRAEGRVEGSAVMVAVVELPQGLSRKFQVGALKNFEGREATIEGTLPLRAIRRYVQSAQNTFADSAFASATVTLKPSVHLSGALAHHALDATFSPELDLAYEGSTLTAPESPETTLSGDSLSADPLTPSNAGKIEFDTRVPKTVPLMIAEPSVSATRTIGFGIAGMCLVAGLVIARPLGRGGYDEEPARIRTLYGSHLIELTELSLRPGPVARVGTIEALVDLAKNYESKIMHVTGPEGDSYSVWDNGLLYEYRPTGRESADEVQGRHADQPDTNGSPVKTLNGKGKAPYKAKT
jgi:hypothetical protein